MSRGSAALVLASLLALASAPAPASQELWNALRVGGLVVLIRHASTDPGTGDPPGFRLEDCATQRNLSAQGRDEARRIGEAFRRHRVPVGEVLSSQWCRCLDTARLAFGRAEAWPALNSNFNDTAGPAEVRNREAVARISERPAAGNRVLVTHNFNIRDLTGEPTAQGEMVIVAPLGAGKFRVLGKLMPF